MNEKFRVLKGGNLIDGTGKNAIKDAVLVMKSDRVESVGPAETIGYPQDAEVIDVTGKTIMPGLIDAHLHLLGIKSMNPLTWIIDPPELRAIRSVMDAWKLLDSGYTTVRDCGNPNTLHLKKAIEEGSIIGPRIVACGAIITQTAGHGDMAHFLPVDWVKQRGIGRIADGADECRKAAREQLREGADFIKICTTGGVLSEKDLPTSTQFTVEEIRAMAEEAHNVGAKIASHAHANKGIRNALVGGVDTIEHGFYLDDELIEMMLKQNNYLIPTLIIVQTIVDKGAEAGIPEGSVNKAKEHREPHLKSFEKAFQAGVKIGCGSDYLGDSMTPMGDNAIELVLQVEAGRTPMDVIVSATKINAEVLGLEDKLGTLEVGKLADLIVVKGDPLSEITVLCDTANIVSVFKGGVQVPRLRPIGMREI